MTCNCNIHKTTALTTAGLLTVTDPNNIGNFDPFKLVLTICPNAVITGAAVPYTVTINGTAVPIIDRWGYPITSDRLFTRKLYCGRYIESETPHVTLMNALGDPTPATPAATSNSSSATRKQ